jgi:hypothetical protein
MVEQLRREDDVRSREELAAARRRLREVKEAQDATVEEAYARAEQELEHQYERARIEREREEAEAHRGRVERPLARKLLRVAVAVYLGCALLTVGGLMLYQYGAAKARVVEDLESIEAIFGQGLAEALWNIDEPALAAITAGLKDVPVVSGFSVWDDDGQLKAKHGGGLGEDPSSDLAHEFACTYDVYGRGLREVGRVRVFAERSLVLERLRGGYLLLLLNTVLVGLALAVGLAVVSRRMLGEPLSKLANAVSGVNLANLDSLELSLGLTERNELKVLEQTFNHMVRNLVAEKRGMLLVTGAFEKFLPPQVLRRLTSRGGPEALGPGQIECMSCTLLVIRFGPSAFDRRLEQVADLLLAIEEPISTNGGFFFHFDPEGVIALFELGEGNEGTEALSACYAALALRKAAAEAVGDEGAAELVASIDRGSLRLGTVGTSQRLEALLEGAPFKRGVEFAAHAGRAPRGVVASDAVRDLAAPFEAVTFTEAEGVWIVDVPQAEVEGAVDEPGEAS